jgi:DNA-directed RNA polymerase subunit beta'
MMGAVKRGNREITIEAKDGVQKKYLVPLTRQILAQDGDFVKAGTSLSDGQIAPFDILSIKGPFAVQEYVVNEIQEVYRLQGVRINDKHIEVIVRQMMRKVNIVDPGDTRFLEDDLVDKFEFVEENDYIFDKKVVTEIGDSGKLRAGQIVSLREVREENSILRRSDKKLVEYRDAKPATSSPTLLGITKASLGVQSWISAASFQETTKVLSSAAINGKTDDMLGLKENVITGHPIPAGTGLRDFDQIIVGSKEEYELLQTTREAMAFDEEE